MHLSRFQSFPNQIHVGFGSFNAVHRLFLETMQNIDRIADFYRIDRPVGIAPEILDYLQDARATKTLKRFGLFVLLALLCQM